jgi:hypothetical protein
LGDATTDVITITGILNDGSSNGTLNQVLAVGGDGTPEWTTLSTLETDPQVGPFTTNGQVARWNNTSGYLEPGSLTDWSGTVTATGDFAVNGNTTLGDATTDVITINGNIENSMGDLQVNDNVVPFSDNTYDLGSSSKRWNDIFLGGNILVDGYIQNPSGSVTVNDPLVVTGTSTLQGAVTAQNGVSVTTGGVNIQNGGLTVQNGGAFIQTGNLIMGAGNIESSGPTVTINDNLSIPDGAGTVKLSYNGYTVPGSNNLTVNTGSYSVVTISSNNDGFADNISLSGGTDGQILYVYFIGTDQINIAGESLISPINGRIGITLVHANSGWQIVGSYVY